MVTSELRDKGGFLIGRVETDAAGRQTLRDKDGFVRGTYTARDNTTRDVNGSRIGSGNLLATLL